MLEAISIVIGVAVGIISIFSFFNKPIVNLNVTITNLIDSLNDLKEDFKNYSSKNSMSHRRLWEHEKEQDEILKDHEIKIRLLQKSIDQEVENEQE